MHKPTFKKLTNWVLTVVFLVFVAGVFVINQPSAFAMEETISPISPQFPVVESPVVPQFVAPVQSVSANIRHLLETNECVGCNLEGAQLKDANLQAANLEGANLQEADLERTNLQGTNLKGANLQGVDLGKTNIAGANLEAANLYDADLEKANLQGANLQGANLQKADLQKANLTGADLLGANLRGADLEDAIIPRGMMIQSSGNCIVYDLTNRFIKINTLLRGSSGVFFTLCG